MIFDWTINLGQVVTLVVIIGGSFAAFKVLQNKVENLTGRMIHVESEIGKFVEAMVCIARQDERLKNLERRRSRK